MNQKTIYDLTDAILNTPFEELLSLKNELERSFRINAPEVSAVDVLGIMTGEFSTGSPLKDAVAVAMAARSGIFIMLHNGEKPRAVFMYSLSDRSSMVWEQLERLVNGELALPIMYVKSAATATGEMFPCVLKKESFRLSVGEDLHVPTWVLESLQIRSAAEFLRSFR